MWLLKITTSVVGAGLCQTVGVTMMVLFIRRVPHPCNGSLFSVTKYIILARTRTTGQSFGRCRDHTIPLVQRLSPSTIPLATMSFATMKFIPIRIITLTMASAVGAIIVTQVSPIGILIFTGIIFKMFGMMVSNRKEL